MTTKPPFTRRDFLLGVGAAGGAAAVYGTMSALGLVSTGCSTPPVVPPRSGQGKTVAILGAGIAGLSAAYELRKGGYDVHILEARARPGGRVFTVRSGTKIEEVDSVQRVQWDAQPDLFFDAGAARLPAHHLGIIGYARELGVPLEIISNDNRNALLHLSKAFEGKPQKNRRVHADARGFVAELAAKAIDQTSLGRPLSPDDREKLITFLKSFGSLDDKLTYRGSIRGGFVELPGGGHAKGRAIDPLNIEQLLSAGFWSQLTEASEAPTQAPTMMRPVGGMSKIAEAMARSLRKLITYEAEVTRIRRQNHGGRIEWRDTRTGKTAALDADYVIVTIQPGVLAKLDHDFTPQVRTALAAPTETPLAKVGFQAKRRFWELDDQIYGGISWTDHPITQIWYPSNGINSKKGILVGAYVFRDGEEFAKKTPAERIELALQGGEILHPRYREFVEKGVSISWRKVKYSSGATTHWDDHTRRDAYPVLLEPDGPYYFAGEYLSYINGWQEGAVQSAHFTVQNIVHRERDRTATKGNEV